MAAMVTANEMARMRWAKLAPKARKDYASAMASAYWSRMTPEQRSAEMRRRAKVRARNRKKR